MERTNVKNNIGEILRLLRISCDLSISELSQKTKISKSYITEIEKGEKNHQIKTYRIFTDTWRSGASGYTGNFWYR